MNANNIHVGDSLRLKPDASYRYGLGLFDGIKTDVWAVTAIETRGHYKTPWIVCTDGATIGCFRPSDFKGCA